MNYHRTLLPSSIEYAAQFGSAKVTSSPSVQCQLLALFGSAGTSRRCLLCWSIPPMLRELSQR